MSNISRGLKVAQEEQLSSNGLKKKTAQKSS